MRVHYNSLLEMSAFKYFPTPIVHLMELFFKVVDVDNNIKRSEKIEEKVKNYNQYFKYIKDTIYYEKYYYKLKKTHFDLIEEYFSNNKEDMIIMSSYDVVRVYYNLEINFLLLKLNLDEVYYYDLIKRIKWRL